MRFKDLIGRRTEPEVSPGRLVTPDAAVTPGAPERGSTSADSLTPGRPAPIAPIAPVSPDSLADVFARLLAAEQGEPPPPPSASVPLRLSDADIERVAARVAERFATGPLREDVRRIVAEVAERLVQEEIRRIRRVAESQQP